MVRVGQRLGAVGVVFAALLLMTGALGSPVSAILATPPPPTTCPAGYTGTPPACVQATQSCPGGTMGVPPACVPIPETCPAGEVGTPPACFPALTPPPPPAPSPIDLCLVLGMDTPACYECVSVGIDPTQCVEADPEVPSCTPGVEPVPHDCLPTPHPINVINSEDDGNGAGSTFQDCAPQTLNPEDRKPVNTTSCPPDETSVGYVPEHPANTPFRGGHAKELCSCQGNGDSPGGGTVQLFNGELRHAIQPVIVPAARGPSFTFDMTYRSLSPNATHGDYGPQWSYAYGAYIHIRANGNADVHDGAGRSDEYVLDSTTGEFVTPASLYNHLDDVDAITMTVRDRYGEVKTFTRADTVYPYTGDDATYQLTKITDANGNSMRIWPGRAALDAQNRLFYFNDKGIWQFERLLLNDTYERVVDYEAQFNWTTAQWEVRDHTGHRLASDPWNGARSPTDSPAPLAPCQPNNLLDDYNPSTLDLSYEWKYGAHAWNPEVDIWDAGATACKTGWDGTQWIGGNWAGRPINDADDWTLSPPPIPGQSPDENHNNNTLDNWPNCNNPDSHYCVPDTNFNWTMEVRQLASFEYYAGGQLKRIELPNKGNTSFEYDANDLLLRTRDGNGVAYIDTLYDAYSRVAQQRYGYGFWTFTYDTLHNITRVEDPNGNLVDHWYQGAAHPLPIRTDVFTNRDVNPLDADAFTTTRTFNHHGELLTVTHPRGDRDEYVWDTTNTDRLQQGNLLCKIEDPGPYVHDIDGNPQLPRITTYTYEPEFNQVASMTTPPGNDPTHVPQNGGANSEARYTTTYVYEYQEATLGDVNGDGITTRTSAVRIQATYPTINPNGSPHSALSSAYGNQVVSESWQHNEYGQVTKHTKRDGTYETWTYARSNSKTGVTRQHDNGTTPWPMSYQPDYEANQVKLDAPTDAWFDPYDGEGFVSSHVDDAGGFASTTTYARDLDGNPTTITDANGNTVHLTFQSGCRLTNATAPQPFGYETRIERDANGMAANVTQSDGSSVYVTNSMAYDILGNTLVKVVNASRPNPGPWSAQPTIFVTGYCYDLMSHKVMERRPESSNWNQYWDLTSTIYDERGLVYNTTQGDIPAEYWLQPLSPANPMCGAPFTSTDSTCVDPSGHFFVESGLYADGGYYFDEGAAVLASSSGGSGGTGGGGGPAAPAALTSTCTTVTQSTVAAGTHVLAHGDVYSRTSKMYDANGNLILDVDPLDRVTVSEYDGFNRNVRTTDPIGTRREKKYDAAGNVILTRTIGERSPPPIHCHRDETLVIGGLLTQMQCQPGPAATGPQIYEETRSHYDEANQNYRVDRLFKDLARDVTLLDGPATPGDGYMTSLTEYDAMRRTVRSVNDNLHASTTAFDTLGRVTITTDAAGNTVEKTYDLKGNVLGEVKTSVNLEGLTPDRVTTASWAYDEVGESSSFTNGAGQTTNSQHDAQGNTNRTASPMNHTVVHLNDGAGRVIQDQYWFAEYFTDELALLEAWYNNTAPGYTTNAVGGNTEVDFQNGTVVVFQGSPTIVVDPVTSEADINGTRIVPYQLKHQPMLNVTYDYDADGRLVAMRDGLNQTTTYTYDALGRKTYEHAPDGTWFELVYDAAGNVVTMRDANQNWVNSTYDDANRLILVEADLGPGVIGTTRQAFTYDAVGHRVTQTDETPGDPWGPVVVAKTFSSFGNVLTESVLNQTVRSTYDGMGNRIALEYPNGRVLLYEHDVLERLSQVWDYEASGPYDQYLIPLGLASDVNSTHIATYSYIGPSLLYARVYENGVKETWNYDDADRVLILRADDASSNIVAGFEYTYDSDGRKTSEEKLHAPDQSEAYGMDELGRLVQFDRGTLTGGSISTPTPIGTESRTWNLDHANNWANVSTTTGGASTFAERTHTVTNEVATETIGATTETFSYDDNGNLLDDGNNAYKWDFKNRLREVHDSATGALKASYWYDAENRRVRKDRPQTSEVIHYTLDGMHEIQETGACTALPVRQFVYGRSIDELLVIDRPLTPVLENLATHCDQPMTIDPVAMLLACGVTHGLPTDVQATGACGPCSVSASALLEATPFVAVIAGAFCGLCPATTVATNGTLETPNVACTPCSALAYAVAVGIPPSAVDGLNSGCEPCGPTVYAQYTTAPSLEVAVTMDCTPCPPMAGTGIFAAVDGSLSPTIEPGVERDTKRCGKIDHPRRLYVSRNEQQNVYALTNTTGARVEGYAYDPYGAVTLFEPGAAMAVVTFTTSDLLTTGGEGESPYQHTGRRHDSESGLLYFRTRYLDTVFGRFISRDTIGVWADGSSMGNSYGLCAKRPMSCTDPTGTISHDLNLQILLLRVKENMPAMDCPRLEEISEKGMNILKKASGVPLTWTFFCSIYDPVELGPVDSSTEFGHRDTGQVVRRGASWLNTNYPESSYPNVYGLFFVGRGNHNGDSYQRAGVVSQRTTNWHWWITDWDEHIIVAHEMAHLFGAEDKGRWAYECTDADGNQYHTFMNENWAWQNSEELDPYNIQAIEHYFYGDDPSHPAPAETPDCPENG